MLKIYRKPSDVDKNAPYRVFLGESELCTLTDNESKDFNFKAGTYKIKVVGAGFHSKEYEFELFDDQIIQLVCYPAYKDSKMSRWFYKTMLNGEGIYLEKDKDFYL